MSFILQAQAVQAYTVNNLQATQKTMGVVQQIADLKDQTDRLQQNKNNELIRQCKKQ